MAIGDLASILSPMFNAAEGLSGNLVSMGRTILELSVTLTIINEVLQYWVGGGAQQLIGKMIRLAIITSIPAAVLAPSAGPMQWGQWGPMNGSLVNFFTNEIAGKIAGSSVAAGDPLTTVENAVTAMFAAFPSITHNEQAAGQNSSGSATTAAAPGSPATIAMPSGGCPSGYAPSNGGRLCSLANSSPSGNTPSESTSTWYAISHLGQTIATLLAELILLVPTTILSVALIFCLYGPLLMLLIGVILGPVLIAWLPFEPMSFLATGWLRYMISMGMACVVGILLATIGTSALQEFSNVLATPNITGDLWAYLGGIMATVVGMLFLAHIMFKVEHIAAALVSGPGVGGGASFLAFAAGRASRMVGGKKPGGDSQKSNQGQGDAGGGAGVPQGGGSTQSGGGSVAPSGASGQQSSLSAQAAQTSQTAQQGVGSRLRGAAATALRSDAAKYTAFAAGAALGGPVGAAVAGAAALGAGPMMRGAGAIKKMRSSQGGGAPAAGQKSEPSSALSKTQPLRKVHVPDRSRR